MPLPPKSIKAAQEGGGMVKDFEDPETPSNNLWVGNLSHEVTESDLMALFAQYGALDSVTSYSSRSYGFVFFKRIDDAKAAKNALQGTLLRGIPMKIEFARPAKPCKQLWVGGISLSVTKEELEAEFRKFGKIEDFKFVRDRNTAFVEYYNLDDATHAMKMMNGKRIGGDQIRVDFLRSQSSKKDMLLEYGQLQGKTVGPPDFYSGQKRPLQTQPSIGRKGDSQPSNILWIGYPPSLQIDEQMLHNAMILFGEIERIKSFPSRHYSFVEFRSVDEARRAKEGLQGRLFNDPRITIMYSSSELAPGKDYPGVFPVSKGPKPDMFLTEQTFRPLQVDVFGHSRPMVPNNLSSQLAPGVIVGPNVPLRPFGPQGSLEPSLSGIESNELGTNQKFQDGSSKSQMGPNWKRLSPPAPGMLHPAPGIRPPTRSTSSAWDVFDINQFQRDSKRSRIDGALPVDDVPFPLRNADDRAVGLEQSYGMEPVIDGGSGPFVNMQGKAPPGPVGTRISTGVPATVQVDIDHIWRGIIAKGGTPVCQARCVPIGKGIGTELPEVVDCSARTGLDMLTKHYADAVGFDIVFFLPDSEDDFASYTEFLRYLGAKNRAGVAKFVDGTTLFLVPPSDFLTKVLKVAGPERLYGVVLKFPSMPSGTSLQQPLPLSIPSSRYIDRQQISPSQVEYSQIPAKEEEILPMDYNRLLHDESKVPSKPLYPATSGASLVQSVPSDYTSSNTAAGTQPGVTLTPELIATLASLLPGTTPSSTADGAKPAVGSSTMKAPFPPFAPTDGNQSHVWKQDHLIADPSSHVLQQAGSTYYQPYPLSSTYGHPGQVVPGSTNIQDSAASLQQQVAISSRPMTNLMPSQSGQVTLSLPVNQPYQVEVSSSSQKGYGVVQGIDASVLYSSQAIQNPNISVSSSNQVHGANPSQQQTAMPYSAEKVNAEPPNQQFQPALQAVSQGASSEVEADKNQRYQSTLQFAASLLLQIQQQQQTQGGRGAGNQQ
ncbi:flowering time control protein FPA [Neltuma alba]|uniref:flowering time control protein FPA n=1 Tax=Neltuma alba TaxID=207710 RepID=UPI0010A32DFB|nr:flowering time control protein FPA [Prosopis alba]XP_028757185.1 flowering time control protein FPA [Prosopis alba]